jgi:hypothetical protein
MRNIRFAIATALAAALTLAGCTAAAATSGTTRASASKPAPPPDLTHVTAYSINTDNHVLTSVVSGAIGDFGPAEILPVAGTVASRQFGQLALKLTRGTFRLDVTDIGKKFVQADSHEPTFPRTCSTWASVAGNVPIVPGSGTGAYRGIAGTFAMTLTLNEVHNSPCTTSLSILRQVIVLSGMGKITKP